MVLSDARRSLRAALAASLFSEPSGRTSALVMFGGAAVFLALSVAFGDGHDLVMGVGFGLSGAAESLPAGRRRLAGALRTVAILLLLGLLASVLFAPAFVLGQR